MPTVPISLTTLPAHSIFERPDKLKGDEWELVDRPDDGMVGTKSSRMIMRDKDLIIASGSEIRVCTLGGESWNVVDASVGSYKVSHAPPSTGRRYC